MEQSTQPVQVTIDGVEYDMSRASETAKLQIANIEFTDEKIAQLNNELAISSTARVGYLKALGTELNRRQS